ncbi:hypothetical protein DXG03_008831 [Asterophora parasitica]|uniref:Uncharacterized protein n=1 Tax=Asterophora parasitica TaxID=117018 RepID=A0A9P7KDW0_9AGAR|nr:hypothetical protein DXG03_008831 [Asterophora parasitica]
MSTESSFSDENPPSLSLEIPGSLESSVESSLASPPTPFLIGILSNPSHSQSHSTSNSTTASTSSLPTRPSISFAPLPELAPRKRRSAAPLGMAARSQLVRRRRQQQANHNQGDDNPMWTDEELERQRQLAMKEARRRQVKQQQDDVGEEGDGEDPFAVLGRAMKGAGKSIWRKVSRKELAKRKAKEDRAAQGESPGTGESQVDGMGTAVAKSPTTGLEEMLVLTKITPEGEHDARMYIDDDEDDDEHFLHVGQTETIREGHATYAWITEGDTKLTHSADPLTHV